MRNNKRGKPGLSPALLCSVMECYSNPQLPWILCCVAAIQNNNLLHCTLDATALMVLFDDEARNRKHPNSHFSWLALFMMSSDVGVCSRAAGKVRGRWWWWWWWWWGGRTVSSILEFSPRCRCRVWHMLRRIIISPAVTQPGPLRFEPKASIQSNEFFFFFFWSPCLWRKSPEHRKHVSLMSDTHAIWLIKQPRR